MEFGSRAQNVPLPTLLVLGVLSDHLQLHRVDCILAQPLEIHGHLLEAVVLESFQSDGLRFRFVPEVTNLLGPELEELSTFAFGTCQDLFGFVDGGVMQHVAHQGFIGFGVFIRVGRLE